MLSLLKKSKVKLNTVLTLSLVLVAEVYLSNLGCILYFGEPEVPECLKK